jgi:hypothetical protein
VDLIGSYVAAERAGNKFVIHFIGPAVAPTGIKPGDVVLIDTDKIVASHGRFYVFPFSAIYSKPKENDGPRNDQSTRKETRNAG